MAPSTHMIRMASGKNEVSISHNTSPIGMSSSSCAGFGASFGLMMARPIT